MWDPRGGRLPRPRAAPAACSAPGRGLAPGARGGQQVRGGAEGFVLPGASLEQGTTCQIQNHWIGKEGGLLPTSSNHSQASPEEEEGIFSLAGVFSTSRAFPELAASVVHGMLRPWCLSGGDTAKSAPGQRPEPGSLLGAGDGRMRRRLAGGCGAQGRWRGAGGTSLLLLARKTPAKPLRDIQVRGRNAKSPNALKRKVKS